MDTAATDGSAKRSRVDRLKQRRLRRDSDALTQTWPDARVVRTINRIDQRNWTVWNIKDNGLDDGTAPILPSTWTIV